MAQVWRGRWRGGSDGGWIESDVRAFEAAQERSGFGNVHAGLMSFGTMDIFFWRMKA